MNADLLNAALAYANQGLPVFPCQVRSKRPLVEGGLTAATTNAAQVHKWWITRRLANIGIPTGAVSGLLVLDIDPGGDESLAALLVRYGSLPKTREVKTGRGRQLWFRHPGVSIRCNAGALGQGLDIRGDGGYIIAPPSLHPNGQQYRFLNDCRFAEVPERFIMLLTQAKIEADSNHDLGNKIPTGQRNAKLTSIGGSLRRKGLPKEEICEALRSINSRQCDPPLSEIEVAGIAASVARYSPGLIATASVPTKPSGFTLVGLEDLLARPDTPINRVWQERLAAGTVSAVVSKPKVGKSTFARNLCLAVARGDHFLGLPTTRGLCVYLALEERIEDVAADFRAEGASGQEQILVHADVAPAAGIRALIGLVQELKPLLVVIDPLFRLVRIRDEKAYAETYAALGPLIDLTRNTGTHVLLTHHMAKGIRGDLIDSPLGSTAIGGAASSLIILKRTESFRTIATVQRLGRDMPETVLQIDCECRQLSLGETRHELERREYAEAIAEYLGSTGAGKTEPDINRQVSGKTAHKRKALGELLAKGRVNRTGSGRKGDPYVYEFPSSLSISGTGEQESRTTDGSHANSADILVPNIAEGSVKNPESQEQVSPPASTTCTVKEPL